MGTGSESRDVTDEVREREQLLRALIDAHGRTVRVALARAERDTDAVDELWADVFHVAFGRLDDVRALPVERQRMWLIRAAGYLVANHGRRGITRRRALERLLREPVEVTPGPEDLLDEMDKVAEDATVSEAIGATLALMREVDRQVLILDALGHDGPSIGRQLGISSGAARKRLMVARAALRDLFPTVFGELSGGEMQR